MRLDVYPTRELVEQQKKLNLRGKAGIAGEFPITFENFVRNCIQDNMGSRTLIGDFQKGLILSQIFKKHLREQKLTYFNAYLPGYGRQLGEVIGELKRQNIDPEEFRRLGLSGPAPGDIARIYEDYQTFLDSQGYYDKEDRYRLCLSYAADSSYVAGYDVIAFKEFYKMPLIQRRIVEVLGAKARVTNSALRRSMDRISVVEAQDRKTEVYHLAQRLRQDLLDGLLPERACIAVRSQSLYRRDLGRVFREAGIPLCLGERHALIQNPFVKALFSALEGNTGVYFEQGLMEDTVLLRCAGLWAGGILEVLSKLGYPAKFYDLHQGDLGLIQRDIKALEVLRNILQELWDTGEATGEALDLESFLQMLRRYTQDHTYGYANNSPGIAVLSPANLRGLKFDKIYALGLVEGEFPRDFRPDWLLRDEERQFINQRGYNLDTIDLLLERERESFGYLTSCSDDGYFSYPLAQEDGAPTLISSYLEELKTSTEEMSAERVSFAEAFRVESDKIGDGPRPKPEEPTDIPVGGRFSEAPFSASGLNSYGQCPFKFFLEKVLNLSADSDEETYTKMDRGSVLHRVLERFYASRLGQRLFEQEMETYAAQIRDIVDDVLGSEYEESFRYPKLYELERDELTEWVVKYLQYHVKTQGDYRPVHLEHSFGFQKPFSLKGLPDIKLRGIIDRIDMSPDGDVVIFDYKNSWTPSVEEIYEGTNLQLPLYILAAQELLGKPVKGAAYISMKESKAGSILVRDKALPFAKRKRKGVFTEEQWEGLMDQVVATVKAYVEDIRRGYFPRAPKKCPKIQERGAFCDFAQVCPLEVESE